MCMSPDLTYHKSCPSLEQGRDIARQENLPKFYLGHFEARCDKNVVHWRKEWQTTSVFLPWEPHEHYEKTKSRTLKDDFPRSGGAQHATRDQWRNNSRKNEEAEPRQKQHPAVDVTGDGSKVRCCKEQYYIGTWNVRSMNQGKLEVVKQEMASVNVDILGIS